MKNSVYYVEHVLKNSFFFSDELIQQQQSRESLIGKLRNDLDQETRARETLTRELDQEMQARDSLTGKLDELSVKVSRK